MKDLFNMHFFSQLVKYAFGGVTVLISAILSYTFFKGIQPAGMDIFPFVALALTEGGLAAWLFVFSGQKHHPIKGFVAIAMVAACLITTAVITFAELIQLFQDHTLVDNATVKNGTLILLEVMLFIHLLAVVSDFMVDRITALLKEVKPQSNSLTTSPPALLTTSVQQLPQSVMSSQLPFPLGNVTNEQLAARLAAYELMLYNTDRAAYDRFMESLKGQSQSMPSPLSSPVLNSSQANQNGSQQGNSNGH